MGKAAGRVMGIDFGTRHIGVAVSDEQRVIARGIETVNWNGEDPEWALNRICEIIREMEKRYDRIKWYKVVSSGIKW